MTSKNGNGFLAAKIKYIKKQKRQSQTASIGDECCSDAEDQGIVEESSSQPSSCQEDLEFLKIAVVNSDNMNIIKAKLAATSKYRRDLISAKHSIDLLENFPYFFYNAELVNNHCPYVAVVSEYILNVYFAWNKYRLNSSSAIFTGASNRIVFSLRGELMVRN